MTYRDSPITVVIPVGPEARHRTWLREALESCLRQTLPVGVVLIDDMAGLPYVDRDSSWDQWDLPMGPPWAYLDEQRLFGERDDSFDDVIVVRNAWRLGVGASFNVGVAWADGLALMLGADDWLHPEAAEDCYAAYTSEPPEIRRMGFYYLPLRYEGHWQEVTRHRDQHLPCNAAMVHTDLWRATGGFPLEGAVGAPDAALASIMLAHHPKAGYFYAVGSTAKPLYHHRIHSGQETRVTGRDMDVIVELRNRATRDWRRPEWGRDR